MSLVIHSQHFHDEEGQRLFPELMMEAQRVVSRFDGYIALRRLVPANPATVTERHMLIEFRDQASWDAWVKSPEHDELAAKFTKHWTRTPQVQFFTVE